MTPEERIVKYLNGKRTAMQGRTLDEAVTYVKSDVFYGMPPIPVDQIRQAISRWAITNAPGMLVTVGGGNGGAGGGGTTPAVVSNSEFIDAVKKAVKTVADGVKIGNDKNNVTILVTGPTVNLLDGAVTLESSWTGTLELGVNAGPLHFGGTLGTDQWQIQVSFPNDTPLPNAASLGKVFGEGEAAMRKLAKHSRRIKNLDDAKRVTALLKPEIAAVQEAADTLMSLAKNAGASSRGGFEVGFKIGSPPPGPGQDGIPKGYEGSIVFTYRW